MIDPSLVSSEGIAAEIGRAVEYVKQIVVESDGYPMEHSADTMRTLLANAFLAGRRSAATELTAHAQTLTTLREALTRIRNRAHQVAANNGWGEHHAARLGVDIREEVDAALAASGAKQP